MKYVKRGALDCFTVVACEKRAAVGVCLWVEYAKRTALDCFTVVEYEIRTAVGEFRAMEYVKRGALDCFMVVGYEKRTAFSCPCVGAYCIRPTNDPPKGARALPLVVYRHSPSMGWRFVGRMPYAPTLMAEK